ncbi:MAG: PHP domain-containing protein [Deltaproteobacteria bacterium]|nr:PHP domain-containing protein [Deltaproteobacteria bacterium]
MDLHIHTNRYSGCSNLDPSALLRKARDVGLDGIVLTEHGIRWSDENLRELVEASGVKDLLVLVGQEVACYTPRGEFQGEFLLFGYPRSLGSSRSLEVILKLVHGEGGVVIAAHPFKKIISANGDGFYGAGHLVYEYDLDGLEVAHPSYDRESTALAEEAMRKRNLAGIGCSDAHDLMSVGLCRSVFPDPVTDMEGLCEAIRERRVKAISMKAV